MQPPVRLALFLPLLAAACGSPGGKTPGDGGLPGSPGDITATVVGPAGATLATEALVLTIPPGALTADVSVAARRLDAARIAGLPAATAAGIEGTAQLSAEVFAFTPHGTTFAVPVEIELAHTGQGNVVLRLDNEQDTTWEYVPGATFESGKARFSVTGFSVYAAAAGRRVCGRDFCAGLSADLQCGVWPDPCGVQLDLAADCGRGCGSGLYCNNKNQCQTCASNFSCATTTAKCGIVVDNCGASHDVNAECPLISGCARGTCTSANQCSTSCDPYPTCAEALAAADKSCGPTVPNGCGGTMDCSNSCTGGQQCFYVTDPFVPAGGYDECRFPCGSCPANKSMCNSNGVLLSETWICTGSYCSGAGAQVACGAGLVCHDGNCE